MSLNGSRPSAFITAAAPFSEFDGPAGCKGGGASICRLPLCRSPLGWGQGDQERFKRAVSVFPLECVAAECAVVGAGGRSSLWSVVGGRAEGGGGV